MLHFGQQLIPLPPFAFVEEREDPLLLVFLFLNYHLQQLHSQMVVVGALLVEAYQALHHFFQSLLIVSHLVLHRVLDQLECGAELADENRSFFCLDFHLDRFLVRVPVAEGRLVKPDFPPAVAHTVFAGVLLKAI